MKRKLPRNRKNGIFYLGFFDDERKRPKRFCSQAASSVYLYLLSCLEKMPNFDLFSINNAPRFVKGRFQNEERRFKGATLIISRPSFYFAPFFKSPNRFDKSSWAIDILKKNVTSSDIVIAYHSLDYLQKLVSLQRKIHFKLIFQVEELYTDARKTKQTRDEEIALLSTGSGFIFASESLRDVVLPQKNKPSCILYGVYQRLKNVKIQKFADGKIHLVYSGTFDPLKHGVDNAIMAMDYLDENFVLHILGSENPDRISELIALHKGASTIKIEGPMYGDSYTNFLSKCDIGLSTQSSALSFNDTSFPSKILAYLSCDLKVVSCSSTSVLSSSIYPKLFCYLGDNPKTIANAIENAAHSPSKNNQVENIEDLDKTFTENLKSLIEKMN